MNGQRWKQVKWLCEQIAEEQDQATFLRLVTELSDLLEETDRIPDFAVTAGSNGNGNSCRETYNPYLRLAGDPAISELLISMIETTSADFGNVQLFDPSRDALRITAQRGFNSEFLDYFETVRPGQCSCGEAMRVRSRIVVNDILCDPLFRDPKTQDVMLRAHVRSCQSSPLIDPRGEFIGMVSTHFERPRDFSPELWEQVDELIAESTRTLGVNLSESR